MFETTEIYGIFVRLLGLVYAFQFATSAPQLMAFIGRDGVEPVEHLLAAFRRDHGSVRGFFKLPTAFWFSASDASIRILPWVGVALGISVSSGLLGSYSWVGVLGCWGVGVLGCGRA